MALTSCNTEDTHFPTVHFLQSFMLQKIHHFFKYNAAFFVAVLNKTESQCIRPKFIRTDHVLKQKVRKRKKKLCRDFNYNSSYLLMLVYIYILI